MAPQRWKVLISIVAVNRIEVIDHINWLHNEFNIYGGDLNHYLLMLIFFFFFFTLSYSFILWFDLPICGNEQVIIFIPTNVQFENVSFFIKVSDEEKFLLF